MHKTMLYGVDGRVDGRGQMSVNPFQTSICERVLGRCNLASWCGVTQYRSCQSRVWFSLSAQRAPTPLAPSLLCTGSPCVTGDVGFPLSSRANRRRPPPSDRSCCLKPLWRLTTLILISLAVRNKWPSETHYTSARFGEWSDTPPDYQIHHLYWIG